MEPEQLTFDGVSTWEIPPTRSNVVEIGTLSKPIWTETKAQLIQNYLRLFLYITKHGVYMDGFAGPQDKENPNSWAAKLVLELEPHWMNGFFLCEQNPSSYELLVAMLEGQAKIKARSIERHLGDFNVWVDHVLQSGSITEKTATFALLDQRSIECDWHTVEKLAKHKAVGHKIELFYFFPTAWIHRTISGVKEEAILNKWWGDTSWKCMRKNKQGLAVSLATDRIMSLGYRDVKAWPISSREAGEGRAMYHMIHATDHLEAPKLMYRAYNNLIRSVPVGEQLYLL